MKERNSAMVIHYARKMSTFSICGRYWGKFSPNPKLVTCYDCKRLLGKGIV